MSQIEHQDLIDRLVRDEEGRITSTDRNSAIALAVARYSKDRPRLKVEDLVGDGSQTLSMPAAWEPGFSSLSSLEYPVGSIPPNLIETSSWGIYNAPSGEQIQVASAIQAGASVRATYTIAHVVDDTTDTIPSSDREPFACWAAAILCDQLATLYSGDSAPTIQVDSVNHGSKASEFASRAKALRKRYLDELGIDEKRATAAGVVVNMQLNDSQGRDRLTHPNRYR